MKGAAALLVLASLGCRGSQTLDLGDYTVTLDGDSLSIRHLSGSTLDDIRLLIGTGAYDAEMQLGSFRFEAETRTRQESAGFGRVRARLGPPWVVKVLNDSGALIGALTLSAAGAGLALDWAPVLNVHDEYPIPIGTGRIGLSAACDADDHFLGLGAHALDVDHVGEAFAVWVSEPGVGRSDSDGYPPDWQVTGTRHSTSFPAPFLLRPHDPQGLLFETAGRLEVDLCASSRDRFEVVAWDEGGLRIVWFASGSPLGVLTDLTAYTGRPELPPPWVFSPWNDAVRGRDEVERVATVLREAGATTSVIWTGDWAGGEETADGYRPGGDWTLDEALYPDPQGLSGWLHDQGFKWFGYFSPFVTRGTAAWTHAVAQDVLIKQEDGEIYTFPGATLETVSLVDLSTDHGRSWFRGYLEHALDLGFSGWMADGGEWLPADAHLASGHLGIERHNVYPEWWQQLHVDAVRGRDASFFVRSGWSRTGGMVPVVWAGAQRTSFDQDQGLPSVLPLGLGLAASGVPVFTHDVAGYHSRGNPPSDAELWYRWASLGAYTPIFRTHHGAFDLDNWRFDADADTLAHYVAVTDEHMRLFPYRYGLAARASNDGIPMILPVSFVHGGEDWGRTDAWMLGDALLVAPVVERGATGRQVQLPDGVAWYDWHTLQPAVSGWHDAPLDRIPVFVAGGTTVPTLAAVPDTAIDGADPSLTSLSDVDTERVVYLIGGGGRFAEADGTTYTPTGRPSGPGELTIALTSGTAEIAGVSVKVTGTVPRTYTFVVVP